MEKNTFFWGYNSLRSLLSHINHYLPLFRQRTSSSVFKQVFLRRFTLAELLGSKARNSYGFTLIELITVIGILAILSSVVLAVVNPLEQFNKAQDSRRKSDLSQIQKALEVYYQDHQRYPYMYIDTDDKNTKISTTSTDRTYGDANAVVDWGTDFRPYMDVLPIDPKTNKSYAYWTDDTGQSYALFASLDRKNDPQACTGTMCSRAQGVGPNAINISCGQDELCTYGVTSPNITP
jgi:prepilin-type N-terminal cleavage/methylation domain-containing protein